jgi:hypothetical protein
MNAVAARSTILRRLGVTLQPLGRASRGFCELYRAWETLLSRTMRQLLAPSNIETSKPGPPQDCRMIDKIIHDFARPAVDKFAEAHA